jgi:hypothetical protein
VTCAALLALAVAPFVVPPAARAGPPLITDDPRTVAHRAIELRAAAVGTERGSNAVIGVVVLDLGYGLTPTLELDATLLAEITDHDDDEDGAFEYQSVPLEIGFKWQFVTSAHLHAALAPTFSFDLDTGDNVKAFLPLQLEVSGGRLRLAGEAAFVPRDDARDGWFSGIFAGLGVGERSELLAEFWSEAFRDRSDPQVNWALGLDWALSERLHLLAAGGTGIYGGDGSRREWDGYLGLQLDLGPFGSAAVSRPTRLPAASLAESPLLELTDRQLSRSRGPGHVSHRPTPSRSRTPRSFTQQTR